METDFKEEIEIKIKRNFTEEEIREFDEKPFSKWRNKVFYYNYLLLPNPEMKKFKNKYLKTCVKLYSDNNLESFKYFFTNPYKKMELKTNDIKFNICLKNLHNHISEFINENSIGLNYCQKNCQEIYNFYETSKIKTCSDMCHEYFEKDKLDNFVNLEKKMKETIFKINSDSN